MQWISRGVHNVLKGWKAEAKNTHLCVYAANNGVLTIYTDRPGCLIGRAGNTVAKYRQLINEASFGTITDVKFVETQGIF
mgnify:CR=1 FL=1